MMRYATAYDGKTMARAMGVGLPISMKKSVELCSFVKGRPLAKAVMLLHGVVSERVAVPFRRYAKGGTGHKPGVGPARYPKKACLEFIKLLKQVEANAKGKGLDPARLVVSSMVAKKGAQSWHFGRQRRTRMKRTHVEIVVEMAAEKNKAGVAAGKGGEGATAPVKAATAAASAQQKAAVASEKK